MLQCEVADSHKRGIVPSAEDLNQGSLVGSDPRYGIMDFRGQEERQRRHQGNDDIFKFAAQLTLQVLHKVLHKNLNKLMFVYKKIFLSHEEIYQQNSLIKIYYTNT